MLLNELRAAGFFDVFEVVARRNDGAALPPTQVQWYIYKTCHLICSNNKLMSSIFILKVFTFKVGFCELNSFTKQLNPINHYFFNIRRNKVMYISRRHGVASCAPTRSAPWGSWRPTARPSSRDNSRRKRAAGGSSAAGGPDTSRSPERTCLVKDL